MTHHIRRVSPRHLIVGMVIALAAFLGGAASSQAATQTPALQLHLLWSNVDEADMDRQLDLAQAAGARMVRVDVGWSSVEEAGKGKYNAWYLKKVDAAVAKAEARGIKLLFTFTHTPCWASSAPDSVKQNCEGAWWSRAVDRYAPSNPNDYADAFAYMVARYGDRVAAWEIWNEPNQDAFFKTDDQPGRYAALVKAAYPAAKRANSGPTILAGSVADSDFAFTERLYDLGIKGNFDAYSVHPYSVDRSPLDPMEDPYIKNSFARGIPAVHATMARHGDGDKQLWLTEFGWSTTTARTSEPWRNGVDADVQAKFLKQAFNKMRDWSYVPVGVYFKLRDTGTNPLDRVAHYGLLNTDGSQKPAFAAFRSVAAAAADGSSPAPDSGPAPDNAPSTRTQVPAPPVAQPTPTRTAPSSAPRRPGAIRLRIKSGAHARRYVTAAGRLTGAATGTVRLTAYHSPRGSDRYARVTNRWVVVRNGAFEANVSRFKRGRWRVLASLRGVPSAVQARQFRLEDGAGGGLLPSGITDDGRRALGDEGDTGEATTVDEQAVGEADFGDEDVDSPGELESGGYLAEGSDDGDVADLQRALAGAGYELEADGSFGEDTEAAVRDFQRERGLTVDGIVGRQTMTALEG